MSTPQRRLANFLKSLDNLTHAMKNPPNLRKDESMGAQIFEVMQRDLRYMTADEETRNAMQAFCGYLPVLLEKMLFLQATDENIILARHLIKREYKRYDNFFSTLLGNKKVDIPEVTAKYTVDPNATRAAELKSILNPTPEITLNGAAQAHRDLASLSIRLLLLNDPIVLLEGSLYNPES